MSSRGPDETLDCLVVTGPTATGKTALGVTLARRFGGEIVSADSRQVYRRLDIGSGKDLAEYSTGGPQVPYHCIDVAEPGEDYNLFRYCRDAAAALRDCRRRGCLPIVVGGTPLYINALLDNYHLEGGPPDPRFRESVQEWSDEELIAHLQEISPVVYARSDLSQRKRVIRAIEIARSRDSTGHDSAAGLHLNPLLLGPYYPRPEIHKRIEARLDTRIEAGLIQEVEALHDADISWERLESFGLEYRYTARYLQGKLSKTEFRDQLLAKIRQFCKAQEIWFRKMEREGKDIYWIPGGDPEAAANLVETFLAAKPLPEPDIRMKEIYYGPKQN